MKKKSKILISIFTMSIIISGTVLYFVFRNPQDGNGDDGIPVEQRIDQLLSNMTVEEKVAQLHGLGLGVWEVSFDTADNDRLGIPGFNMMDGPHGVRSLNDYGPASAFPVGIAMTSTWDTELLERIGVAMGEEFRGFGINQALGPCIDLQRDPRNGRSPESGGEDPYLAGWAGTSLTRGIQSVGTIATVKHFAATNHQEGRRTNNYTIDERSLMELYGLPFRLMVQQGDAWSVMSAYNYINDESCSTSYNLLTEILRDTWGYDYYVTSDWWSIYNGAAESINAGIDVDMPGDVFGNELTAALKIEGTVTEESLDQAVRRVLRTKIVSGMMDRTPEEYSQYATTIGSLEHNRLALEAAQKSIILLKNEDNILPLDSNIINSIALIGPSADVAQLDGFGSSEVIPIYSVTPKDGIESRFPDITINYAKGCDINSVSTSGFQAAKDAAAISDVVIFVGGLDKYQEGEGYDGHGDRTSGSVALPGQQQNLINELAAINPNVVVVLESGGICTVEESFDNIKGFLYAFYPGHEGGRAIADVLFGNVNPGGKLPVTMPMNDSQLPDWVDFDFTGDVINGFGYRRFDNLNMTPRYPFGYGLSYTTFEYGDISVNEADFDTTNTIIVNVEVTNDGTVQGDEIVQLYLSSDDLSVQMPEKQLRGFKRVSLDPGQTKVVSFALGPDELNYWSTEHESYMIESGIYTVRVGGASNDLPHSGSFTIDTSFLYDSANNTLSSPLGQISLSSARQVINGPNYNQFELFGNIFTTNLFMTDYKKKLFM